MKTGEKKKSWFTPKRIFWGSLSLGALGFGAWYLMRKTNKPGAEEDDSKVSLTDEKSDRSPEQDFPKTHIAPLPDKKGALTLTPNKKGVYDPPASDFPLKKGSHGEKVKALQLSLMAKYPGILKHGADGVFGGETIAALKSKGLPLEISQAQFSALTAIDPQAVADNLYMAVKKKEFFATMAALQNIRTPKDYSDVNEKFKAKRLNGVTTTIVSGLLATFSAPEQKDQLTIAFTTMGLEKADGKWKVPEGIFGFAKSIITTRPTKVWRDARHMVQVGSNVILGYEVSSQEGITVFDTIDGYRLNVMTSHVKYN